MISLRPGRQNPNCRDHQNAKLQGTDDCPDRAHNCTDSIPEVKNKLRFSVSFLYHLETLRPQVSYSHVHSKTLHLMNSKIVTSCVLIIGNEILSGRTQDTNLSHIANTLGAWGIRVTQAQVIPDVEEIIIEKVNSARARFDYVFTTGGIGPTHDDITAACIARAFHRPLVIHPEIEAVIRSREAPEEVMKSRMLMARVPEGAGLIENPTRGPQGFFVENVYVMAGIPVVMQGMLSTLKGKLRTGAIIKSRSVSAYLGESQVADALGQIQDKYPEIDLGSYPFYRESGFGTTLVMRGIDEDTLSAMYSEVEQLIIANGAEPVDVARD